ncbi:MAG: Gfo/Idh/MocA family oxidoreductase [Thermofilaceae archaeon]|nr:Gfo/Idh/MocA family oxidoreductase [Thermofilaceae archaeon]MCX8180385.1 Gfo/Idh/MocA family oxidoreductase [Thermofilaceae archaeon]MDW8003920.1 Gfo/Idh/MocA family oxidoreductase [Thermofilaceae archaeon]
MEKIGVALVGAGFAAKFHVRGWVGVRDSDIVAIYSRTADRAKETANLCEQLGVGKPKVYTDLYEMLRDPRVNAVWVLSPNYTRLEIVRAIAEEAKQGKGNLLGVACEKPLARNVKEAREMLNLVEKAGLLHGYLENQVFMPSVTRGKEVTWRFGAKYSGRPYLARAAEEHGGPHASWFWKPTLSGGGVLLDMMCHSLEAARYMIWDPEKGKDTVKPKRIWGEIASLKWTKREYIDKLKQAYGVDYSLEPAEDYASAVVVYEDEQGNVALTEAHTSWSFIGAGLRLTFEVLGPEYSLWINSLQPELFTFFSRNVRIPPSEEFVEKQNADQGLIPVIPDEAVTYGYQAEDRYMVECFLKGVQPFENWHDGLLIVQLMMLAYLSAEKGKKLDYEPSLVEDYIPPVQRGCWNPKTFLT